MCKYERDPIATAGYQQHKQTTWWINSEAGKIAAKEST